MKRVVIAGGFTEGLRPLERVGEAACQVFNVEQFQPFLFRDIATDASEFEKAGKDQIVLTHSAGVLAVTEAMRAKELHVYNGPEVSRRRDLVKASIKKTFSTHPRGMLFSAERAGHARALASNTAELFTHAAANLKHLGRIAAFSTLETLSDIHESGASHAFAVHMDKDEFFQPELAQVFKARLSGMSVTQLEGYHDDLLVNPQRVLSAVHG